MRPQQRSREVVMLLSKLVARPILVLQRPSVIGTHFQIRKCGTVGIRAKTSPGRRENKGLSHSSAVGGMRFDSLEGSTGLFRNLLLLRNFLPHWYCYLGTTGALDKSDGVVKKPGERGLAGPSQKCGREYGFNRDPKPMSQSLGAGRHQDLTWYLLQRLFRGA